MQVFNTVVSIWISDTEALQVPILGVFDSVGAARINAIFIADQITKDKPELRDKQISISPYAVPLEAWKELLTNVEKLRAYKSERKVPNDPPNRTNRSANRRSGR